MQVETVQAAATPTPTRVAGSAFARTGVQPSNQAIRTTFGSQVERPDVPSAMRAAVQSVRAAPLEAKPVFDFPDFHAGDEFKLAKGSKMNSIGISGNARIEELTSDRARLWIKGGKWGITKEATIDIAFQPDGTARMHAEKSGGRTLDLDLKVLESRRNLARFEPVGFEDKIAQLEVQADGRLVLDFTDVQDGERFHLVLEKQLAEAGILPLA